MKVRAKAVKKAVAIIAVGLALVVNVFGHEQVKLLKYSQYTEMTKAVYIINVDEDQLKSDYKVSRAGVTLKQALGYFDNLQEFNLREGDDVVFGLYDDKCTEEAPVLVYYKNKLYVLKTRA